MTRRKQHCFDRQEGTKGLRWRHSPEHLLGSIEITDAATVKTLAEHFYRTSCLIWKYRSFESDVFKMDFTGQIPNRILKLDRGDDYLLRREQEVVLHLGNLLPGRLPTVEHTQADLKGTVGDFTIMLALKNVHYSELYSRDVKQTKLLFAKLGAFFAKLQTLQPLAGKCFRTLEHFRETLHYYWEKIEKEVMSRKVVSVHIWSVLDYLRKMTESGREVFGHNSPQLIISGWDSFCMIDWTQAGTSYALYDLTHFLHRLRAWDYPEIKQTGIEEALLKGFFQEDNSNRVDRDELSLWEIFHHLRDASWHYQRNEDRLAQSRLNIANSLAASFRN